MFLLAIEPPSCCLLLTACPLLRLCSRTFWRVFFKTGVIDIEALIKHRQLCLSETMRGSSGGREIKSRGLGFSIKGHKKVLNTSWSSVFQVCHWFQLQSHRACVGEGSDGAERWFGPAGREVTMLHGEKFVGVGFFFSQFCNQKGTVGVDCMLQPPTCIFPLFSKCLNLFGNVIKALGLINIK